MSKNCCQFHWTFLVEKSTKTKTKTTQKKTEFSRFWKYPIFAKYCRNSSDFDKLFSSIKSCKFLRFFRIENSVRFGVKLASFSKFRRWTTFSKFCRFWPIFKEKVSGPPKTWSTGHDHGKVRCPTLYNQYTNNPI